MMLKNKNVIVTGAGRGIGRAIAEECAAREATVVILSRTISELQETEAAIKKADGRCYACICDISSDSDVSDVVSFAHEKCGQIDVLVNNAGVQPPIGPFSDTDMSEWKKNVEINLFGTARFIHAVLPEMIQRKRGKIIILSGGGSTSPRPNFTAYAVSKTALVRLTETLAMELKQFNVDVNAISPGAINTKMLEEVIQAGKASGDEFAAAAKRKETGGDDPKVVAGLVSFLASDVSDGITGKLISAKWDPWRDPAFQQRLISDRDLATLRRIDAKNFEKIEKRSQTKP